MKKLLASMLLLFCQTSANAQAVVGGTVGEATAPVAPPQAIRAGYTKQTYNFPFNTSTVDTSATTSPGFAWYLWSFFGGPANKGAIAINGDGTLTVTGGSGGLNGQIGSITALNPSSYTPGAGQGWHGTAFGGGAYFEAVMKFNPGSVNVANGWPAFWLMSMEHLVGSAAQQQWAGQTAGYNHFLEVDIVEYYNQYTSNLFDWYGVYNVTCPSTGYCSYNTHGYRNPTIAIDNNYHKYGYLWIASTGSRPGSGTYYVDDVPVTTSGGQINPVTWTQFTMQAPPPAPTFAYGVGDNQHLVILAGTGTTSPITIQSLKVWQASTARNITQ